jgi:hypothetical protein
MGAPSVGDYTASHSLLLRALPDQVNPFDLWGLNSIEANQSQATNFIQKF